MTTRQVILNVDNSVIHTELIIKGEIDSRFLEINLLQNSNNYDLTNDRVFIDMQFPDNSTLSTELTIENAIQGLVLMPLTSQMSTQLGNISCAINIKDSATLSTKLSIVTLKIAVINQTSVGQIESASEYNILQNLISEASQYSNKVSTVKVNGTALTQDANHAVNVECATPAQGTKADAALPASSYNANNTLAQLLTVDTDTSGLNATTLQGNAPSAFATAAQGTLATNAIPSSQKGVANGVMKLPATLPTTGKILKEADEGTVAEAVFDDFATGFSSGNNTNGSYLKLPDGTMFEWGLINRATGWQTSANGTYFYTSNYPMPFVGDLPICIPIMQTDSGTLPKTVLNSTQLSTFTVRTDSGLPADNLHWRATGRWK